MTFTAIGLVFVALGLGVIVGIFVGIKLSEQECAERMARVQRLARQAQRERDHFEHRLAIAHGEGDRQ